MSSQLFLLPPAEWILGMWRAAKKGYWEWGWREEGKGKGGCKPTPPRWEANRTGAPEVRSAHLGPEDTTVQSAGGLVIEKVKLQCAQSGWRKGKR